GTVPLPSKGPREAILTRVPPAVRQELNRRREELNRRRAAMNVVGPEVSESQFLADVLATLVGRTDLNGEVTADLLVPMFDGTYDAEKAVADGEGVQEVLQLSA
ncbi:hypothetical protein, partial [Streptomyces sp. NPDC127092]